MINFDEYYQLAIDEMKKTVREEREDGKIDPAVGAVILLPNKKVHSAHRGELRNGNHAEFTLLERKLVGIDCSNSTMFVTLEPCAVGARNAPKHACCEWIVGARIKTVYIGIQDPDPTVAGKGIQYLIDHGVEVRPFPKIYQNMIREFNSAFIKQAKTRNKKEKEKMTQHVLDEFVPSSKGLAILSKEALKMYSSAIKIDFDKNPEDLYENLLETGLIEKDNVGNYRVTKNALVLFGVEPTIYMQQSCIKYHFQHANGHEFQDTYDGPMILAIDDAIEKIQKFIPLITKIDRYRQNETIIPERVLREALINSIAHRDYSIDGAKISIQIYYDRIVINSPGLPQLPVTLEAMKKFEAPSFSRNPKLTYIFRKIGLMEENRLGMNEFAKMPKKYHLKKPDYDYKAPNIEMTLWFEPVESPLEQLKPDIKLAYRTFTKHKSLTTKEYMKLTNLPERTASRQIKSLTDAGLVRKVGTAKNTKYIIDPDL